MKELAEIPRPAAVKAVLRALDDPVSSVVEAAVLGLCASKSPQAHALIAKGLRAKSARVRLGAANALGVRAGAADAERGPAFAAISAAVAIEVDKSAAQAMALALHNTHDARAVDALLALLESNHSQQMLAAASVLGLTGDPRILDPLARALEGYSEADMMRAVVSALAYLDDPKVVDVILARLGKLTYLSAGWEGGTHYAYEDPVGVMMPHFLNALAAIKHPKKVDRLIVALRHDVQVVRVAAAMALGQSRDPRAEAPLRALLSSSDEAIRRAAELGLDAFEQAARAGETKPG